MQNSTPNLFMSRKLLIFSVQSYKLFLFNYAPAHSKSLVGISNSLYVSLLVKYAMSSTNTLTYNNSNGLYLVCPIGCEIINKVLSHSTLELVQGVLVHVHTTFLSFLIYCMTHHQKSYVAKSTNNYLTTIGDALTYIGSNITHI